MSGGPGETAFCASEVLLTFPAKPVKRFICEHNDSFGQQATEAVLDGWARAQALGAVISCTLGAAGTFDEAGWLRIGLAGHQPSLGENYISTGSLYLALNVFLPLGLPARDPFWTGPAQPWTSQRVWAGQDAAADHPQDA